MLDRVESWFKNNKGLFIWSGVTAFLVVIVMSMLRNSALDKPKFFDSLMYYFGQKDTWIMMGIVFLIIIIAMLYWRAYKKPKGHYGYARAENMQTDVQEFCRTKHHDAREIDDCLGRMNR